MKRIIKLFSLFFMASVLSSCFIKGGLPKNLCQNQFLKDIANYSKSELAKLAQVLESSTITNNRNSGCQAALLGQIYLAQGRILKASDYFSIAAQKLPDISEYFLLAKARAELKKPNLDKASKIASILLSLKPGYTSLRLHHLLADIAIQKKDDQEIIKTHQNLLENGCIENETLLFNFAKALTNVGEHKKASEVYKRILINFPLSIEAKHIEKLQDPTQYALSQKDIKKRFDKLIEKLAFDQVIKESDLLLKKSSINEEDKDYIKEYVVKSLLQSNRFDAGIKTAQEKNATAKEQENYAWALAKVGHFIEAAKAYGQFLKKAKDKEDLARGCFFQGFSLYEASLYKKAILAWQGCEAVIKNSSYYENYLWHQALAHMLDSNYQKAFELLKEQKKLFPKSKDLEKYTYFLGHTLYELNNKSLGDKIFHALAKKAEPSYYVLLSQQTLDINHPLGEDIPHDALSKLAPKTDDSDCQNALLLFNLGFKDEARDVILRSLACENEKLAMLQHLGFYHDTWQRSHLLKSKAKIDGSTLKVHPHIRSAFPLPHKQIVDDISQRYNINKNLVYAIIREESGFSKKAVSYRGAIGLMQMMPFVAEELANLSMSKFNSENLNNPESSIKLGALLIALLQRQFNDPHLVVAAYNAGPHQVQKWLNSFGHLPILLFVERIPFKQTRDYIKKVLLSESLYHAMNGNELRLAL